MYIPIPLWIGWRNRKHFYANTWANFPHTSISILTSAYIEDIQWRLRVAGNMCINERSSVFKTLEHGYVSDTLFNVNLQWQLMNACWKLRNEKHHISYRDYFVICTFSSIHNHIFMTTVMIRRTKVLHSNADAIPLSNKVPFQRLDVQRIKVATWCTEV